MSILLTLALLVVTLMCSAFFSGMEIAFISSSKLDVELEGKKGGRSGRLLQYFSEKTAHFISTTLLGNNIALVLFGLLFNMLLEPWLVKILPEKLSGQFSVLLIITMVSTIVILFVGEYFPKNFFRYKSAHKLSNFIIPFWIVYILLYFPVILINLFSKLILGKEQQEAFKEKGFTRVDVEHYVSRLQETISVENEDTTNIFYKALNLSEVKARECIVPRNEVEGVDENASIEEVKQKIIETKFSKLIVYNETLDQPLGYIHHLDILKGAQKLVIHSLPIFPEATPVRDILQLFIKNRKSVALIVDEFGGTAGIVTIEDIIEEIFGEIEDEHDQENAGLLKEKISDTEYLLSGRLEIDLLNEEFELEIPIGDYETIAGFITAHHENIPKTEEIIEIDNFIFTIEEATQTKIESVRMFIKTK